MVNKAVVTSTGDDTVVTNARHFEAVRMVVKSLKRILLGFDSDVSTDLLSF